MKIWLVIKGFLPSSGRRGKRECCENRMGYGTFGYMKYSLFFISIVFYCDMLLNTV